MSTTADRLRDMRRQLIESRKQIVRDYYDMANAQMRGEPIKDINNGEFYVFGKNGRTEKVQEDSATLKVG